MPTRIMYWRTFGGGAATLSSTCSRNGGGTEGANATAVPALGAFSDGSTGADAYNIGLFYTFPAGTELRLTYSEVSNDSDARYDFGISPAGVGVGGDLEMWAIGMVQWF